VVRVLPDPPDILNRCAHLRIEAARHCGLAVFFDNLGRNKRWDSVDPEQRKPCGGSGSRVHRSLDVSLRQLGVVQVERVAPRRLGVIWSSE